MIDVSDIPAVSDALSAIRSSIDSHVSARYREREYVEDYYLRFEALRIRFVSRIEALSISRKRDVDRANQSVYQLWEGIGEIIKDPQFSEFLERVRLIRPIRPSGPGRASIESRFALELQQFQDRENRKSLLTLFYLLHDSMEGGVGYVRDLPLEVVDAYRRKEVTDRLKKIVPDQKVAPLQFDIVDGRITLASTVNAVDPSSAGVAANAKEDLVKRGEELISSLRSSNCDRRLLENLNKLQTELVASKNIIALGISNISFGLIAKAFEEELPTALSAQMHAHAIGVNMYVAQFPDWIKFSENAAAAKITERDAANIKELMSDVIDRMENDKELVSPEVPASFKYIREALERPDRSSKRATFAAIRTLENLVSKIFSYGIEFADSTAKSVVQRASMAASVILVGSALTLGISVAGQLGPLAGKIEGMGWIKDAAAIVRKHFDAVE